VLDFTVLREAAATLPGAEAGELEAQYFGVSLPAGEGAGAGSGSARRHRRWQGASLAHGLHVLAARRRAVLDAEVVCRAADLVLAAPCQLDAMDDRSLLAYRLRLIDLAQRGTSAELAVAAAAA